MAGASPPAPFLDTRDRIVTLEHDVREIKAWVADTRSSIRAWTLALVVAILGATGTIIGAAIAYGELRQQAQTNERLLTNLTQEISDLRREIHAAPR